MANKYEDDYNDWLDAIENFHGRDVRDDLEEGLNHFGDREDAFKRLKDNYNKGRFDFFKGFGTSIDEDAARLNRKYPDGFEVIGLVDLGAACSAPRVSRSASRVLRSACTPEEIEKEVREILDGLTLLSDDETQILIGESEHDIALHDTTTDPVLEKVKQGIHTFRRNMATQRLRDREGYHTIIALDEDSLPVAQDIAKNSGEKARALLLDSDHNVLLDDGRVVVMVEGGSGNRISMVGRGDTIEMFSASELAEQVKAFARGGSVESVTVQPVLEADEELDSAGAFSDLEVLDEGSPWQDVAGYVRLQPVMPDDSGSIVESPYQRVGVPGKPGGMELQAGYLNQALDQVDVRQPRAQLAELRQRLAAIRHKAGSAERKIFDSFLLNYMRKVQNLHAEYEVFRASMDQVYADHAPGSGSEVTLSPDDLPLLSTLKQEGDEWKLTFSDQEASPDSHKTLTIDDQRIVDFIHSYSDKIDMVREALDFDLREERLPTL